MTNIKQIDIYALQDLAQFVYNNKRQADRVLSEFGTILNDNGYGTIFLKTFNPLFKTFWISVKENQISAIGFGGPILQLRLSNLFSYYKDFASGFNRHESEIVYSFFSPEIKTHTIQVYS